MQDSEIPPELPTPFETLAAMNKLSISREVDPDFYQRHRQVLDMTEGFIGFLGSHHPDLARIFSAKRTSILEVAPVLQECLRIRSIPNLNLEWVDGQMTLLMEHLIPVVRDAARPEIFDECHWAIEAAYELPGPSGDEGRTVF